jgi:hypothetical protein
MGHDIPHEEQPEPLRLFRGFLRGSAGYHQEKQSQSFQKLPDSMSDTQISLTAVSIFVNVRAKG